MSSRGRVGIGLGVVFVCFLLALMAEVYYVLWWRRRRRRLNNGGQVQEEDGDDAYISRSSPSRELFYLFCWKKQQGGSISTRALNTHVPSEAAGDSRMMNNDDGDGHVVFPTYNPESSLQSEFVTKLFPLQSEGMDSELMRIHGLLGPPRILFTIKEETKEEMESEDGKSRGGKSKRSSHSRSLSDLLSQIGSEIGGGSMFSPPCTPPFLTPSSSPPFHTPFTTPPLTPLHPPFRHNNNDSSAAGQRAQNPIADSSLPPGKLNPHEKLSHGGCGGGVAMEIDDGSPSISPALSGDENASFITIFVNDDSYKLNKR